jgi:hypothetical protein
MTCAASENVIWLNYYLRFCGQTPHTRMNCFMHMVDGLLMLNDNVLLLNDETHFFLGAFAPASPPCSGGATNSIFSGAISTLSRRTMMRVSPTTAAVNSIVYVPSSRSSATHADTPGPFARASMRHPP